MERQQLHLKYQINNKQSEVVQNIARQFWSQIKNWEKGSIILNTSECLILITVYQFSIILLGFQYGEIKLLKGLL